MVQGLTKRLFRKFISKTFIPDVNFSYSQFGEDIILSFLFYHLNIKKPTYLDIGANDPRYISNTYYFYEHGSTGVCIEPNKYLWKKYKKVRPKDTVLNVGIGIEEEAEADFYQFPKHAHGLSTFSKKEALHWQETGMKGMGKINYEKIIKVPLVNINTIIQKYFDKVPDFISIDVEGLDLAILSSLDFNKYKPKVICAETLAYNENQKGFKDNSIADLLKTKGYTVYADTRVNTIFCLNELL